LQLTSVIKEIFRGRFKFLFKKFISVWFAELNQTSTFETYTDLNHQIIIPMNKGQLVAKVSNDAKISKTQANAAIDAFINTTMSALKKGDKLVLVGFGTFIISKRSARKGRNPKTGKSLNIPARKVVKFRAGKDFAMKVK
jgi:DNA-binding protein HU-beta